MPDLNGLRRFVVTQTGRELSNRTGYEITTEIGQVVADVVEVGRSDAEKLAHPIESRQPSTDGQPDWLVKHFEVRAGGDAAMRITRIKRAKKTVIVSSPDDVELGRYEQRNLVGKARIALTTGGEINEQGSWLRRGLSSKPSAFLVVVDGVAIANINATVLGNVHFDINRYEVEIVGEPSLMLIAAPIALDQILFED